VSEIDLDELERVARAALTEDFWDVAAYREEFDPPTVLALIARAREAERMRAALRDAESAFGKYEGAIEHAQRMYHNYTEWTDAELDPIDAAREAFYAATRAALGEETDR
jgi:hypothetical protein